MNFKAIERRAEQVAYEAATERTRQLRDQLAKEVGLLGCWGLDEDFREAWKPIDAFLVGLLTKRNIVAYHNTAEQAAINALKAIINPSAGEKQ
jgi:hypothetical protein